MRQATTSGFTRLRVSGTGQIDNVPQATDCYSLDNSAGRYFRTRDINPVVDSQSAYERARKWIEECSESHQDCLKPEIGPLPSRVIDVEPLKNNDDPRLLITEGIKAPYVALSYCWGSNQPNALLSQRLPEYVKRIPTAALPQTIQDAITVTAKLGIRYLWVDSFCVLQDSPTDKRMEISKMRQIFRHAFVTISAATAPSVFHGFLFTRTQPDPSVSIQLRCPDGTDGVVSLYLDSEEPHLTYLERDHPIEDRAWTLEEKVLSPRVLVYSSTHLRWLCDSSQYSDGGPQENFMGYDASAYRLPLKERERPPHPSQNNVPGTNQRSSWRTLVGEYTRRSLTAPEDKLRAIAGLAEEYERLMGDTYRAGLWLSELATELLWRRNTLTEAGALYPRPRNYRAPSWSWASIDGEVAIRQRRIDAVKFNVVECTTTPVSAFAPFGEVSDARLKVVARTTTVWWNCAKEDIFDGADGVKLGKGVQDAAEDDFSALCAVQALAISANHGLILAQAKSEEGSYRRVGWLYFDNDDMFSQCEQTEITII
jgi:hypothetical protein